MATELELLQKIAANTATDSSLRVALIAGGSAVAGALASAFLSYFGIRHTVSAQSKIERQKLHATVITTERLRWLQDMRLRLSTIYARMDTQLDLMNRVVYHPAFAPKQEQLDELSSEITVEINVLYVTLNPARPDHKALREALRNSEAFISKIMKNPALVQATAFDAGYQASKQSAFDAMTAIGIDAWSTIKELL